MPIGTGAAILGSALISGGASLFAGSQQASAARNALAFQQAESQRQQQNFAPYLGLGQQAAGRVGDVINGQPGWDNFLRSPDYQFRFNEGMRGLENSAAARGGLLSGNFLRGATDYGQRAASQEFTNYFSRLMDAARLGQNTAVGSGSLGAQMSGQIGNTMQGIGAATASGPVGAANALTGGAQNWLFMNALANRPQSSSYLPQSPVMSGSVAFPQSANFWGAG